MDKRDFGVWIETSRSRRKSLQRSIDRCTPVAVTIYRHKCLRPEVLELVHTVLKKVNPMKNWYKLSAEDAVKIYCVPAKIVNDPDNHFWGLTYQDHRELFEGSWPLIALLHNKPISTVFTLQIHTLHMEHVHLSEFEDGFGMYDPLTADQEGGHISVLPEQLKGLSDILSAQEQLFTDDETVPVDESVFRLLNDDEVQFYRLHPEWFPDVQDSYYLQMRRPAIAAIQERITLISVSTPSILSNAMSFSILTFEADALSDEAFTPLRRSRSQLYLNRLGLLELVGILSQAVKQADQSFR